MDAEMQGVIDRLQREFSTALKDAVTDLQNEMRASNEVLRKESYELRERMSLNEQKNGVHNKAIEELKVDVKASQAETKKDIKALEAQVQKDIRSLEGLVRTEIGRVVDAVTNLTTQQIVADTQVKTGVSVGKWVVDRFPWLVAIASAVAAIVAVLKDRAP